MERDAYSFEQSQKTRNTGLVMSLLVIAVVLAFMYADHRQQPLHGILAWRVIAVVPSLLFLLFALFFSQVHRRLTIVLHIAQMVGVMVMMCGITAVLATRPDFPPFGRTALISSLVVCIFSVFVFAAGARRHLLAIVMLPLAAMSAYILTAGGFLPQMEKTFLITNPCAIAVILGVAALYQEKSVRREFHTRTELKLAGESLRQSEKKYRELFDNAEIGMFRSRRDGSELLDFNRTFSRIFDGVRDELIGGPSVIHWADPRERDEMVRLLDRDGHAANFECRLLDVHGRVHACLVSARLDAAQGTLEGSVVDVTDRKLLEAEKLELERRIASSKKLESLGILAGGVAHNFNNLLAVILGNAELLRENVPAEADSSLCIREIFKAGGRLQVLINQLLTLGRRQVLDLHPLDLNDVLRSCRETLRGSLREDIAIDCQPSAFPCPVMADPGRIMEILLNLALNAQDAIPCKGRLTIATSEVLMELPFTRGRTMVPPGRCVLLTVSDTGAGMDQETMARLFDPFFTTKEHGIGTGLGLSTVYGIVDQHGGTIEVESRPEAGTQFRIYFPRTDTPLQPPAS